MKALLLYIITFSAFATGGGGVDAGGGGTKPTKDGRVSIVDSRHTTIIRFNSKLSGFVGGGLSGGQTTSELLPVFADYLAKESSKKPTAIKTNFLLKLEELEEVTLKDGTVYRAEELRELFKK
ncbi:hypothetical protein A9Q84_05560 [Halobacteriovorax marinus]|uniref:Lipoprotein n=1 Tax=Halobacteriovorax marinus TaxID=97084 RepID=A0A1Y5FB07_9BACT|nr:hypothetical protein A9Q84_05560 [Halobacteriovorax marinus]